MIKKFLLILLTNLILISVLFISAEYAYRFYIFYKIQTERAGLSYALDDELGWIPEKNYQIIKTEKDAAGIKHKTEFYSTNEYGFREWGDLNGKLKILVIGDSFTGDSYTSDNDAYFNITGSILGSEIFAVGAGGYGTFQEYLLLKRYVNIIEPNILVLQFCPNDFGNNSINAERNTITRNQSLLRPYLTEEGLKFREDRKIYTYLLKKSFLLRRVIEPRVQKFQYKLYGGYSKEKSPNEDIFNESVKITNNIFKLINDGLSDKILKLSFSSSTKNTETTNIWKNICLNNNFIPIENVSLAVEKAKKDGKTVYVSDDNHWNILGHRIAGEQLALEIKKIMDNYKIK
jgi:hypothetical protein